jgi:hypothetical protein
VDYLIDRKADPKVNHQGQSILPITHPPRITAGGVNYYL